MVVQYGAGACYLAQGSPWLHGIVKIVPGSSATDGEITLARMRTLPIGPQLVHIAVVQKEHGVIGRCQGQHRPSHPDMNPVVHLRARYPSLGAVPESAAGTRVPGCDVVRDVGQGRGDVSGVGKRRSVDAELPAEILIAAVDQSPLTTIERESTRHDAAVAWATIAPHEIRIPDRGSTEVVYTPVPVGQRDGRIYPLELQLQAAQVLPVPREERRPSMSIQMSGAVDRNDPVPGSVRLQRQTCGDESRLLTRGQGGLIFATQHCDSP